MNNRPRTFLKVFSFVLAILNSLGYFAMRNCWSGMSKTLGYESSNSVIVFYLPLAVCFIFFLTMFSELILLKANPAGRKWPVVYTIVEVVFTAVIAVVIMFGGQKYVRFALPHFLRSLAIVAVIAIIYWLMAKYPKTRLSESGLFKGAVLVVMIIGALLVLSRFGINRMTYEPVVYAVEDEYQIVFSGATQTLGSVIINGQEYYDLSSGSERSSDRVHKVTVPMEVLDSAGAYTVTLQQIWYRGPFGAIFGSTITEDYSFRPVDTSDGFKYLSFSDIHANADGAIETAEYVEDCDLLVIDGDTLSMIDAYRDANYVNMIAHEITEGEYPVIYARGNHECKGAYAEQLYKYVGSKNGSFYYSVRLGDIYVLVLDIGEDHDDGWWELYTTGHFKQYWEEQIEFINEEIERGYFERSAYNLVVAHIPIVFVNSRHNHEEIKAEMTKLLNGMMIDMNLCAHQHDLFVFEPGLVAPNTPLTYNPDFKTGTYNGYLTDFNFWSLMISKPGFEQDPSDEDEASHIGLVIEADLDAGTQTCYYINSNGKHVKVVNPFAAQTYGTEFTVPICKK